MGEYDKYDGPDRRENARRANNGNDHCSAHVLNMERIAKLEAREDSQDEKFDTLFQKLDEQAEVLRCLKSGQDVILAKFAQFEKGYNERVEISNAVIAEYRQAMVEIGGRFKIVEDSITEETTERKKSNWFLGPLNEAYQAAPRFIIKWVAIAISLTVVGFSLLHQVDVARIASWFKAVK